MRSYLTLACFIVILMTSCHKTISIRSKSLLIDINGNLETHVSYNDRGVQPLMDEYSASEYLVCKRFEARCFKKTGSFQDSIKDEHGKGLRTIFHGTFKNREYTIEKILDIVTYDSFPDMAVFKVQYVNTGNRGIQVEKWVNHAYPVLSKADKPAFWTFQGSSTNERRDWILPVDSSFYRKNFMGMNNTDYGGGIPLADVWRKDAGIAIGHVEDIPLLISLPVEKDKYENTVHIGIEYEYPSPLLFNPGDTLATYSTFVSVHTGDCFASLHAYSRYMETLGIHAAASADECFEPIWCGWGYEENFTLGEISRTLPKVKQLGLKWVDIDYGYQKSIGDWEADPRKFPHGSKDMRALVDQIHSMGLKVKLWWAPLAISPQSELFRKNPDLVLLNNDGSPQFITFWDSYFMSPVYGKTIEHTRQVLEMFFRDWDIDGLKMDGMHLNCVPPDYAPLHKLENPEEANQKLPRYFKMVYETAKAYKPDAVIQICPCGDAMSFFNMPYTNQTVASDPASSWQIRTKAKTYKALLGRTAYFGDHVELSDGGNDFASPIGVGGIPGTKFTWPRDNPLVKEGHFVLTPEKEKVWKDWIRIYNRKMLSRQTYRGDLYDIGYDKPETHVIQKADTMFYSFYSAEWRGEIELRGLAAGKYALFDYVHNKSYGIITGSHPYINVSFHDFLLLQAYPVK